MSGIVGEREMRPDDIIRDLRTEVLDDRIGGCRGRLGLCRRETGKELCVIRGRGDLLVEVEGECRGFEDAGVGCLQRGLPLSGNGYREW